MYRRKRHEARNCEFIQHPVTSVQLGQNVFHNTQVSNDLHPYFFPNYREEFSHPHKTTYEFIILCMLIIIFSETHRLYERMTTGNLQI